eukprot:m.24397 g.24397  ORF g.24397 m.24397 type:complete len:67 (-) comp7604_c0_seq1:406-606(-)
MRNIAGPSSETKFFSFVDVKSSSSTFALGPTTYWNKFCSCDGETYPIPQGEHPLVGATSQDNKRQT